MTAAAVMAPGALYGRLLATAAGQHRGAGEALRARLRRGDGRLERLALDRWLGPCTPGDDEVLERATGPVLDVGCGPGRVVAALTRRGVPALGVDLSPEAVKLARRRGARAVTGCVFEDVPEAGSWRTALLLDGNIGIGGRPSALLERVADVLAPGGEIIAEVDPPGSPSGGVRVRLEAGGEVSDWFPWATVAADALPGVSEAAGIRLLETFEADGRIFGRLSRDRV